MPGLPAPSHFFFLHSPFLHSAVIICCYHTPWRQKLTHNYTTTNRARMPECLQPVSFSSWFFFVLVCFTSLNSDDFAVKTNKQNKPNMLHVETEALWSHYTSKFMHRIWSVLVSERVYQTAGHFRKDPVRIHDIKTSYFFRFFLKTCGRFWSIFDGASGCGFVHLCRNSEMAISCLKLSVIIAFDGVK